MKKSLSEWIGAVSVLLLAHCEYWFLDKGTFWSQQGTVSPGFLGSIFSSAENRKLSVIALIDDG